MHGPLQTDSLKHSNEYQRLIYGQNFDDFSKFPVCNDLRKLAFRSGEGAWIIQITRSNESFRRKQTTRNVRFHRNQTATKLKHVSLPVISNKEGRLSFHLQLQLPFRTLFRKREHRPILWHYGLSGTLDWWFCQSRFLVLPFPSEVNENPQKSFSLIEPQTVTW